MKGFPFSFNAQLFNYVAISARKAGVYKLILKTGERGINDNYFAEVF